MFFIPKKAFFIGLALSLAIPAHAEATEYNFEWSGQIAGFSVKGSFGFDETRSYADGIVRAKDLDFLHIFFYAPDGTLLKFYMDNHLDPGVNFNFDINTQELLQSGSYNEPDGISLGGVNYDKQSGNDPSQAEGFSFWSKPPRSNTPHMHVDDWADEFGFPIGYSTHEDVSFPSLTTSQLAASPKMGDAYSPPNGQPVTPPGGFGQFARVTAVSEHSSLPGLSILGRNQPAYSGLMISSLINEAIADAEGFKNAVTDPSAS
ncbi:MAG: hypothetical protein AAF889_00185 [Cyanobacteria bacterium P01_D01_bin.73]